jgi:hypothetical protein
VTVRERSWLTLMCLIALALVCTSCAILDWYPDGKDCRSKGCPEGETCKPTGGIYYACQVAPSDPPPVQQPNPGTTIPPPTPEPPVVQPPVAGCSIDGEPGPALPKHPMTAALADHVDAAMLALRPMCTVGSRCLLGDMTIQAWTAEVIRELRKRGVCAGQHEPGITDEIAVAATATDPREGYHVGAGDDSSGPVPSGGVLRTVVWSRGAYRGAYAAPQLPTPQSPGSATPESGGTEPAPPVAEPPSSPSRCGDPVPPGIGRVKLVVHNVGPNKTVLDATQYVHSQDYCRAAGFTDGRLFCAFRQEGAADREACEALFPLSWSGPGWVDESNPALWIVPRGTGGTVTACAGTECQSIEVAP